MVPAKTMRHLDANALADFKNPDEPMPKIVLFTTYSKEEPAILTHSDESAISVESLVNFLADNKLWSDEELEAVEQGFGRPLDQIIVQPVNPLTSNDNVFEIIDSNNNAKIDITEVSFVPWFTHH